MRMHLREYEDLLVARTLPEWRFVDEDTIEIPDEHAHLLGHARPDAFVAAPFPDALFDYQRWVVERALDRRRFAAFLTTGLGKTLIQLEWARQVTLAHRGRTLIVAPLNIVSQTIREATKFYGSDLPIADLRDTGALGQWLDGGSGIGITNYEKLDRCDAAIGVSAVVLDESSILKQSQGVRRTALVAAFRGVEWKLCCSATPAPNDRVEYAEHAYFLDIVRSPREFLARFFVNRDGEWMLKRHGIRSFYEHLASWSVFMTDPKIYRFADHLANMPPLTVAYPHVTSTLEQMEAARTFEKKDPTLFGVQTGGIVSRTKLMQIAHGFLLDGAGPIARFPSAKPAAIAELVNVTHADEQVIVWVTFDEEGEQLARAIPEAVHLSGKSSSAVRDETVGSFQNGTGPRVLILKPSMFGFGLNLQSCRVQVFATITDSWERYFQAVRRSWRFGQTREVLVYVPLTEFDEAMCQNVLNKQATYDTDIAQMEAAYVGVLRPADTTERRRWMTRPTAELARTTGDAWTMVHGDSIAHMATMPPESADLVIFSPPFANLFTYSSALADMGNVRSDAEYRLQWKWFAEQLIRVVKPGRVVAIHCMDVIRFAGTHGHRFTYDYPSDLRAGMEDAGFRYHARIAIDKNPQIQATRTKDHNLLFVTLTRNALNSHPQASECVLMFRAPGESETPVVALDISNQEWIEWAHHVWYGIRETDVLNAALGREAEDERHICPLQLSLIERCIRLWSNRGETVFDPFAGIGSTGWESLAWGRQFYGVELKESYYQTACRFLGEREQQHASRLFDPGLVS